MENSALSLLKLVTVMSFWLQGLQNPTTPKNIRLWRREAEVLLSAIKFPTKDLDTLVEALVKYVPVTDRLDDLTVDLGERLRRYASKIDAIREIPSNTLKRLNDVSTYMRSSSNAASDRIAKWATEVDESFGDVLVGGDIPNQDSLVSQLLSVVYKMVERRDLNLTLQEKAEHRGSEHYAEFLSLRREMMDIAKKELRNYVRSKGKPLVDYASTLKWFDHNSIIHPFPPGFNGFLDEQGRLYTTAEKLIEGNPSFPVDMNPDYDAEEDDTYVFSVMSDTGNKLKYYTKEFKSGNRKERFEAVQDFIPDIENVRSRWLSDLKKDDSKDQVLATCLELMYWTSGRVGSAKNNVKGEKTFGISTLLVSHVDSITPTTLTLTYPGKKMVRQHHVLKARSPEEKLVLKNIKLGMKDKNGDDPLFTYRGKPISGATLNAYFRNKGATVTLHKIRHVKGTKLMRELIAKNPIMKLKRPQQVAAEAAFKRMATDVGQLLGHMSGEKISWSTSVQSYIDPGESMSYFKKLNLRNPSWLTKFED